MILIKLHLENFKKYFSFDLEFGEGLIGIIGKNGTGKSTIFEAILFGLYGELKTKQYKDIIRNSEVSSKEAVLIELIFEVDNTEYKVIREFRGKNLTSNAKLFKNSEIIASGKKEVNLIISNLIKMTKEAFIHTLFASQKELTSLSNLKLEERKKMIRKLLGLEKIDFIENEIIIKSRELKREISAFNGILLSNDEIKELNENNKKLNNEIKELIQNLTKKEIEFSEIKTNEIELNKQFEKLNFLKEEKQKLDSEIRIIKNNIENNIKILQNNQIEKDELLNKEKEYKKLEFVKQEYLNLDNEIKIQNSLKEKFQKKLSIQQKQDFLRENYSKEKNIILSLKEDCKNFDEYNLKLNELEKNKIEIKKNLKNQENIEKELNQKISGEEKMINDTTTKISKIKELGKKSSCPICTRPLLEEYDNVLKSLYELIELSYQNNIENYRKELSIIKNKINILENQLKDNESDIQNINNNLLVIKSKQKDLKKAMISFEKIKQEGIENKKFLESLKVDYNENIHKNLLKNLEKISNDYKRVLGLEIEIKRVSIVKDNIKIINEKLDENNKKLIELQNKNIDYDENIHLKLKKQLQEIQIKKDNQIEFINDLKIKINSLENGVKIIVSKLNENNKQKIKIETKEDDLLDYEKLKLNLDSFKRKLNSQIAPRISKEASILFTQITKGKYQHIEVNNDFEFFIYDDGKKYPIDRFSGGEIDLANLVLRIAISKTLVELNGANSIGFLAFDEVFGSQDENRRVQILEAFHLIKEKYRQIFLISHEIEIKEMFEKVIELQ